MSKTQAVHTRRVVMIRTAAQTYQPDLRAVFDYAKEVGWSLAVAVWARTPSALIKAWAPDGILVLQAQNPSSLQVRAWHQCPVPVVVGIRGVEWLGAPAVLSDIEASGRLAAQHFLEHGFNHLAYCWLGHQQELDEQMAGFRGTTEAAGRTFHCLDWPARARRYQSWSSLHFRQWLASELLRLPKPLGLMVESDWTGLEAIEACREASLLIPEQVAVVGYHNLTGVCECAPIALSSIDPDLYRQGREASALLDRLMHGAPPAGETLWIPPKEVVVRQSSDVLAVAHLEVAKALRFIKEHCEDPRIGVTEVVAATAMSKSSLKRAFIEHLGSSIGETLRRTRLEKAEHLLRSTKMTLAAIAAACGYTTPKRLRERIAAQNGMSPRAWRKQLEH